MKTQIIMTLLIDGEVVEGHALDGAALDDYATIDDAKEEFKDLTNATQITLDKYYNYL